MSGSWTLRVTQEPTPPIAVEQLEGFEPHIHRRISRERARHWFMDTQRDSTGGHAACTVLDCEGSRDNTGRNQAHCSQRSCVLLWEEPWLKFEFTPAHFE